MKKINPRSVLLLVPCLAALAFPVLAQPGPDKKELPAPVPIKVPEQVRARVQLPGAAGANAVTAGATSGSNVFEGYEALNSITTGTYNVALGYLALYANTGGSYNVATGPYALQSNTTGNFNVATGPSALVNNTTGNLNVAIGLNALAYNNTGYSNVAIGPNTLLRNETGNNNVATGPYALFNNMTGSDNVATGPNALVGNTTGNKNVAIGNAALYSNTTGERNVAVGESALRKNVGPSSSTDQSGTSNTAVGWQALQSNTTGWQNTAVGESALTSNTTGQHNTAVGEDSLNNNSSGTANTAIGESALYKSTEGSYNVAHGYYALNQATGNYNLAVGPYAGYYNTTGDNNIYVGNTGVSADSGVIRIGTADVSGHRKSDPKGPTPPASYAQTATYIAGITGVGVTGAAVYVTTSGQLGVSSSSRRFKQDIQTLGSVGEKVMGLRPVSFRYRQADDRGTHPLQYGLIAEEVAEVFPELVQYDPEGRPAAVSYHLLTPLLLAELQREHAENQKHQALNASQQMALVALQDRNEEFRAELDALRENDRQRQATWQQLVREVAALRPRR